VLVDVCCGGGFQRVEVRIEGVKAVMDVFLSGGYAAIRAMDSQYVVLIDVMIYYVRDKG